MATHRSLNKLEFRAHMSIHNLKEVEEGEAHESRNGTRDRFGKRHPLSEKDGSPRLRRTRSARAGVLAAVAMLASVAAQAASESTIPSAARNTDIRIETEGLDANSWLNRKLNQPQDAFSVPVSESTSLGFNDDGDPNLSTRF